MSTRLAVLDPSQPLADLDFLAYDILKIVPDHFDLFAPEDESTQKLSDDDETFGLLERLPQRFFHDICEPFTVEEVISSTSEMDVCEELVLANEPSFVPVAIPVFQATLVPETTEDMEINSPEPDFVPVATLVFEAVLASEPALVEPTPELNPIPPVEAKKKRGTGNPDDAFEPSAEKPEWRDRRSRPGPKKTKRAAKPKKRVAKRTKIPEVPKVPPPTPMKPASMYLRLHLMLTYQNEEPEEESPRLSTTLV